LNRTIRELTQKNAELAEARAEAVAAAEEKEAFLARMSHEIRTPLNAIIGFSRILQQRHDGERNEEYLHIINRASTQLLFLVDDVLHYSQLQAGSITINPRRFNLTEQVEDVVAMVSHQAHEHHLELISLIHSDVPEHVEGDPERIAQILLNLLTNALKFTRTGHVFMEVTGPRSGDPPERVCFRVTDTGSGISPEIRQNLFDPFFQGDPGTTRRHGGAGLGLAIAHRLATMMGGDIEVLDRPGPGATFQVTLPLRACNDRSVQTRSDKADVYLYEPHPLSRRALRVMLSRHGTVVCNTGNLTAFLHQLEVTPPTDPSRQALAVVGLSTEQARGDDAERIHREVRERHAGPLLFVVAQGGWQPGHWAKDDRRLAWLSKPVRRTSLARALVATAASPPGSAPPEPRQRKSAHKPARDDKVLYVEDNAFNRMLLGEMLAARGIAMDAVASAEEVDDLLSRNHYGMILTDLHLPDMDGLAVARRIRDRLGQDCPPVVLVTADVMFDPTRYGGDEVFDAALTKPLSEQALDDVLSRWIDDGRVRLPRGVKATPTAALGQRLHAEQARLAQELRHAQQQGDREAISAILHQLKGMAGLDDQAHAVALLRRLESALEGNADAEETASLVDAITKAVGRDGNEG
jgi:two-component system sensor histidine kinase BarA